LPQPATLTFNDFYDRFRISQITQSMNL
ncbi:autotransporter beta-domain protein, partial [Chlamydia psittaci 08DC60]